MPSAFHKGTRWSSGQHCGAAKETSPPRPLWGPGDSPHSAASANPHHHRQALRPLQPTPKTRRTSLNPKSCCHWKSPAESLPSKSKDGHEHPCPGPGRIHGGWGRGPGTWLLLIHGARQGQRRVKPCLPPALPLSPYLSSPQRGPQHTPALPRGIQARLSGTAQSPSPLQQARGDAESLGAWDALGKHGCVPAEGSERLCRAQHGRQGGHVGHQDGSLCPKPWDPSLGRFRGSWPAGTGGRQRPRGSQSCDSHARRTARSCSPWAPPLSDRSIPGPSAPSFLASPRSPAAVSMATELLQQPQRGLRHRAVHPFPGRAPRAELGPGPTGQLPVAAPTHRHSASRCLHWLMHTRIHSGTNTRHVACTTPGDGLLPCPDSSHVQCATSHTSLCYFLHEDPFLARAWHRRDKDREKGRCRSPRRRCLRMDRSQQQTEEDLCRKARRCPPSGCKWCTCGHLCWEHWCFQGYQPEMPQLQKMLRANQQVT